MRAIVILAFNCLSVVVFAQTVPTKLMTETGVRVVVQPDNNSDTVAICIFVRAGIAEERNLSGIGSLVSRAIFGRNLNQTSEEVAHCIFDVGGSLEAVWNPDYTLITCVTTAEQFHNAFYVICQAIKFPEFDRETVDRARTEILADASREATNPFRVAYAALRYAMYHESPYRDSFGPQPESGRKLTAAAAAQFHNRFYSPGNTVISVVGNVRVSDVRKDAENYLVDYKRPEPVQRARNAAENPREAARVTRSIPTNTTTIVAGFAGPGLNDPDYPAFAVLTALIGGGKSSRVFRNVRDASGLGYVVGAYTPPLARESHLLAYVEFDTNRTGPDGKKLEPAVAETMLVGTVKSVVESQPTDKEIERAKSFSIGTHALAHQRTRDRAFYLGWYELAGTGHGFDTEFPRRLAAVTRDEVVQAAKKYLNSCVVSVVQPEKR